MRLTFLGAAHEVTGSCTMVEAGGIVGLVDCGMEQGKDIYVNRKLQVPAASVDFLILTHAHVDHSGNIPYLVKMGFSGKIYSTSATFQLCELMLADCANIQENEAQWHNRKNERAGRPLIEPVYTADDVQKALGLFVTCEYGENVHIAEGIDIVFKDAGHLLGSASVQMLLHENSIEKSLVFSGDIGNLNQPMINDPVYIESADYVITEATYGDRLHETQETDNISFLADCIQRTLDRNGNVVIPSFAIGRTQEILYYIGQIKQKKLVKGHDRFKVVVDSPMACESTQVFMNCNRSYFDEEMRSFLDRGINPIINEDLVLTLTSKESKSLNSDHSPKVIIASSGMCEGGRIRHHLKHNLWRPECMVLFVGYQSKGTTGRLIADGAEHVKILGEEIACKAEIAVLKGKSGHADRNGLLKWMLSYKEKPEMVFINHADDAACGSYLKLLTNEYGFRASAPFSGAVYDLIKDEYIKKPLGVRLHNN